MRNILLLLFFVLICWKAVAQKHSVEPIYLRSGTLLPNPNVTSKSIKELNQRLKFFSEARNVLIQFDQIPQEETRELLLREGIELLEYLPENAYTATVKKELSTGVLLKSNVRTIIELLPEYKLKKGLLTQNFPFHAVKLPGTVDLLVSYGDNETLNTITEVLTQLGFEILNTNRSASHLITLRAQQTELLTLAGLPFVRFVQAIPGEDVPINDNSRVVSRANVLNSTSGFGRNLSGNGIVVGVGDNASPTQHIDFNERVINHVGISGGSHGVHVMGTLAGAGIMNELYRGFAPKATLVTQYFSKILSYAPSFVSEYGMSITNNSYGNDVINCDTFGEYDLISYFLDHQAFSMPYLQHVFAAGNSGLQVCAPIPAGFGNILGGYQTAKNTITVGNISGSYLLNSSSSRGPVNDGRIKPEIVSQGTSIRSTLPGNSYGPSSGTSMATPGVSGGLALLSERYKAIHSTLPKNGFLKAILCNGATDLGNVGPDYQFGFGVMNLLRSLAMLESNSVVHDSVSNGNFKSFSINVPANTAQLKVMLYWNDPAGNPLSSKALVNNLDLTVTDPNSAIVLPLILNSDASHVNDVAQQGVDNLNNMEQVAITNPTTGNYSIKVNGTAIGQNPLQAYFVAYDIIPNFTSITFPVGTEHLVPDNTIAITWDSFGNTSNSFQVEFSSDNGSSWQLITDNLPGNTRRLQWTVPQIPSEQYKVRVIQNGTGVISTSESFTVLGVPLVTVSPNQTESYFGIEWSAVPSATDYEVMLLQGNEMVSKGFTSDTHYLFSGLLSDSTYYASVRARINSNIGQRALAVSRVPADNIGASVALPHDLMVSDILLPSSSGRKWTTTELGSTQEIKVELKNLDANSSDPLFTIDFLVNSTPVFSENVNHAIAGGGTYVYTFPSSYDFSAVGEYRVEVAISHSNDPVTENNSLIKNFKQLENPSLSLPFFDGFESLVSQTAFTGQIGLAGGDKYDFESSHAKGRLRSYIFSGIAATGSKALTLDTQEYVSTGVENYLIGTYNFSSYNIADTDLRLDFKYKNHGVEPHSNNRVWIRGDDAAVWLEVYNLYENQNSNVDGYKAVKGIEISRILSQNGQSLTPSFQVRWGHWGKNITADINSADGYSFDDISFYIAINDLQMIALNNPVSGSCSYGANDAIRVKIRNSSTTLLTNIPVKYVVDGQPAISENIASIDGRTELDYTFSALADLSAPGYHTVSVSVEYPSDSYVENNAESITFYNAPLVTSFPYLENFETNDGYFHAEGRNNSWGYGAPISSKINTAASGSKAWKTNLEGNHNNNELSYLYSPCFAVTGMTAPTLSFNIAMELEVCDPDPCDFAYVEYSADGGSWKRLGAKNEGTNWYNEDYSGNNVWSEYDYWRWHVATIPLPTGASTIQLRFVMNSDPFTNKEGFAIDDIHIYDHVKGIYAGNTMPSPTSQVVPSTSYWTDITTEGKLIASINSGSQNLGSTDAQVFINTGGIRNSNSSYYADRNITIKPQPTSLSDSVSVRLYIKDAEVEQLIATTGCGSCGSIPSFKSLGVSKYSDSDRSLEDASVANNSGGNWRFVDNVVRVPFDIGYYFEFKVKSFSEFWFSKSALGNNTPLPVQLVYFEASKMEEVEERIKLVWKTTAVTNFDHFELEVAVGDEQFRKGEFVKIATIPQTDSLPSSKYQFLYTPILAQGAFYFRLKMIDSDGTWAYSGYRSVVYPDSKRWIVFPNPAINYFEVQYLLNDNNAITFRLLDLLGREILQKNAIGNGNPQSYRFDLKKEVIPAGLYLLEAKTKTRTEVFKVIKN